MTSVLPQPQRENTLNAEHVVEMTVCQQEPVEFLKPRRSGATAYPPAVDHDAVAPASTRSSMVAVR